MSSLGKRGLYLLALLRGRQHSLKWSCHLRPLRRGLTGHVLDSVAAIDVFIGAGTCELLRPFIPQGTSPGLAWELGWADGVGGAGP